VLYGVGNSVRAAIEMGVAEGYIEAGGVEWLTVLCLLWQSVEIDMFGVFHL
jgi:xanthine dehydrogenase molybdopterin-binding subunit B